MPSNEELRREFEVHKQRKKRMYREVLPKKIYNKYHNEGNWYYFVPKYEGYNSMKDFYDECIIVWKSFL